MDLPKTLSKLAGARNIAEQAGLNGTAERLELLKKELAGFKDLPIERKPAKASWAIAKLDETRKSMARESESQAEILSDRRVGHDIAAIVTKILLCASTMFGGMIVILSNPGHPFLIGGAFLAATLIGAAVIDRMVGSREVKEATEEIGRTLDGLQRTLTCQLWKKI